MMIDLCKITCISIALLTACGASPTSPPSSGGSADAAAVAVADAGSEDPNMPPKEDGGVGPIGSEDGGGGGPQPEFTWWQDVEPIVRSKCQLCHGLPPQFGAPIPLVDYADTQALIEGVATHEIMAYRIVADQNRMPPSSQPGLTDDEKRIIQIWSQIGAPEGVRPNPTDGGVPAGGDAGVAVDAGPSRPVSSVLEVRANDGNGAPYELPVANTSYVCWSITVPVIAGVEQNLFRSDPILDNTANTHHILLFYDANGGNSAGPFPCGAFPLEWNLIAGWAPGRTGDEVPAGVGVPIASGAQLVLQVHYDSVTSAGSADTSGMRVSFTDEPNLIPAGILWSGVIWTLPLVGETSRTGICTLSQPVTMFAVFPHMHQLGSQITLEVRRGGSGPWTTLADVSGWSFEDQPNIAILPAEQSFMPGDQIRTTCRWNTQGQVVIFGEASNNEMCFNFIFHYPKIPTDLACVGYSL